MHCFSFQSFLFLKRKEKLMSSPDYPCAFAEKRARVCWRWKAWRPPACSPAECFLEGSKRCKAVSRPTGVTVPRAPQSAVSLEPWVLAQLTWVSVLSSSRLKEGRKPHLSLTSHVPHSSSLFHWKRVVPHPALLHLHVDHNPGLSIRQLI